MSWIAYLRHYPTILQYCLSFSDDLASIRKSPYRITLVAADKNPNPEIWDLLLSAVVYFDSEKYLKRKALDIRGARSVTLLGVVLNHGITITCPLLGEVARYGNEDALRLVLDHLGHFREMNESNALTMAVIFAYDKVEKFSMLLEKGMDYDFVGKMTYDWDFIQAATERVIFGEFEGTALHRAVHLGYVDAVRFCWKREREQI
jgi:hypothetical protein